MSDSSVSAPHDRMANAIRALAMDAVQAAKSGHPGMPMGMADAATVLFTKFLKFDPQRPDWPDRDRFVLSAGHGSMLLYALLHLTGYPDMTMAEIRNFRQLHSRTAGHPEYGEAPGIETTTGPLGQGLANAVGMALAERMMNARFGDDLVDHRTWVVAGDGCLMEGISQEAITLAGHLQLGKLIVLFDDNAISIDGPTALATSDDQIGRFKACGWHVQQVDGHDPAALAAAMQAACDNDRPSMIACKTVIGYGAPTKAGTAATHGAPLGEEEIAGARAQLNWQYPPFEIPADVEEAWRAAGARGAADADAWEQRLAAAVCRCPVAFPAGRGRRSPRGSRRYRDRIEKAVRGRRAENGYAPGIREGSGAADRGGAGTGRRVGRSHRLQQHPHRRAQRCRRRRLFRRLYPLRRARTRHGSGDERHGAARRADSLCRHLPRLHRLCPARRSASPP